MMMMMMMMTSCCGELRSLKHPRRRGVGRSSCRSSTPLWRPRRVIAHQLPARQCAAYRHEQTTLETEPHQKKTTMTILCYGAADMYVARGWAELHKCTLTVLHRWVTLFQRVTPGLRDVLHWPAIHQRIGFNLVVTAFYCVGGTGAADVCSPPSVTSPVSTSWYGWTSRHAASSHPDSTHVAAPRAFFINPINLFSQLCNNENEYQQNNVKHSDGLPEKQIAHLSWSSK